MEYLSTISQVPFYRTAVPHETKVRHKVKPETAGLMIDQQGNMFDCMGRYTSDEIDCKFGGKKAI